MIAFVRGTVASVLADRIVLDVGGVGLLLQCTPATASSVRPGEHCELLTSLVVREDGWTLYGFVEADERSTFEKVQTVAGIGPRIALGLLATLSPDDLRRAVTRADESALMKVPGVGRKGAQRLILELGDRLGPSTSTVEVPAARHQGWRDAVSAGLVSLGWSTREAEDAVASIDATAAADATAAGASADIGALLKAALRNLDRS